jgi:hypothetical protein
MSRTPPHRLFLIRYEAREDFDKENTGAPGGAPGGIRTPNLLIRRPIRGSAIVHGDPGQAWDRA